MFDEVQVARGLRDRAIQQQRHTDTLAHLCIPLLLYLFNKCVQPRRVDSNCSVIIEMCSRFQIAVLSIRIGEIPVLAPLRSASESTILFIASTVNSFRRRRLFLFIYALQVVATHLQQVHASWHLFLLHSARWNTAVCAIEMNLQVGLHATQINASLCKNKPCGIRYCCWYVRRPTAPFICIGNPLMSLIIDSESVDTTKNEMLFECNNA